MQEIRTKEFDDIYIKKSGQAMDLIRKKLN